ncbi:MAG: hypothetical protein Q7V88_05055 [Actinomycetota bacterium]|nr:hypothetical protein [Actinomycetota bacterium]
MGLFDVFVEAAEEVGGAIADGVEAVADGVEGAVETVVETAETVVEGAVDQVVEAATTVTETAIDWFAEAAQDAGTWALETTDDYVFDTVDFITDGAVDLDYDDGQFSANVDLGIASAGVSIGEDGFDGHASANVGIAAASVSYEDGSFESSASAGVDWGPLPYAEGHLNISEDGTVDVGGKVQATIPTPIGVLDGSVEGGYHQLPDGSWGAYGGADATLYTPTGVTVSAGGEVSYEVEADGDEVFHAGGYVGAGLIGGPSVEVGGEYHSIEDDGTYTQGGSGYVEGQAYGIEGRAEGSYNSVTDADGNVTETYEGSIEGSGYGHQVGAGGSYVEQTNADGTSSTSADGWVDVDGLDTDALLGQATNFLGDQAGGLGDAVGLPDTSSISETISNLAGDGDLSEALGNMADSGGQSVSDIAAGLADSGNFDDFSTDLVGSEVAEAVADDAWDDLLE